MAEWYTLIVQHEEVLEPYLYWYLADSRKEAEALFRQAVETDEDASFDAWTICFVLKTGSCEPALLEEKDP